MQKLDGLLQGEAVDGITAHADAGALAQPLTGDLPDSFIGKRAAAGDEADAPGAERQPILLSAALAPLNSATHVILADGAFRASEGFARVFLLFPPDAAPAARVAWRGLDGREDVTRAYSAQEDGKWVKKG